MNTEIFNGVSLLNGAINSFGNFAVNICNLFIYVATFLLFIQLLFLVALLCRKLFISN